MILKGAQCLFRGHVDWTALYLCLEESRNYGIGRHFDLGLHITSSHQSC